jgi:hypothetical protein
MRPKKEFRKAPLDVRNEKATSITARIARAEKTAAYDVKYKADAQARREKLAAEPVAKPAEAPTAAAQPAEKA